jgi:hypothetical protein
MATTTEFKPAAPLQFTQFSPSSTSSFIQKKHLAEILPNEQTEYSYGSNEIIRFNISSPRAFLYGQESYFRWKFQSTSDAALDGKLILDEGGMHALIRSVEVRSLSSGVLLQRYDNYNRYVAVKKNGMSAKLIEEGGNFDADSVPYSCINTDGVDVDWVYAYGDHIDEAANPYNNDLDVIADPNKVIMLDGFKGADPATTFLTGDKVHYFNTTQSTVFTVTMAEDATLKAAGIYKFKFLEDVTASVNNNVIELRKITPTFPDENAARKKAVAVSGANGEYTWCFQIQASALLQTLPLFVMKNGIEIAIELENPVRVMYVDKGFDNFNDESFDYKISTPRFMAMMVQPIQEVIDQYVDAWQSPNGLMYAIPSVRTRRLTGKKDAGDENFQMNVGVRAARKVYTIVQDSKNNEGNDKRTKAFPAISMMPRGGIKAFQYKVGAMEFPHRKVNVDNVGSEALLHLANVYPTDFFRFTYKDWSENVGAVEYKLSATPSYLLSPPRFIMATDLSRDQGPNSALTGVDLSINALDLVVEREEFYQKEISSVEGEAGNPVYFNFIEHDSYMKIQASGISVFN